MTNERQKNLTELEKYQNLLKYQVQVLSQQGCSQSEIAERTAYLEERIDSLKFVEELKPWKA